MARNSESFRMAAAARGSPSRLDTSTSFWVSGAQASAIARARVAGSELLISSAPALLARQASRPAYDLSILVATLPSGGLPYVPAAPSLSRRATKPKPLPLKNPAPPDTQHHT